MDLRNAIQMSDVAEVRKLLKKGENPNVIDDDGKSLINIACNIGNKEIIKLLLQHKISLVSVWEFYTKMVYNPWAYNNENVGSLPKTELLELFLDHILPVDDFQTVAIYSYAYTPLQLATLHNEVNLVALLIKRGADVNKKTTTNETLLQLAAAKCNLSMIKFLLDIGTSVNEISHSHRIGGCTVFHAIRKGTAARKSYHIYGNSMYCDGEDYQNRIDMRENQIKNDIMCNKYLYKELAKLKFKNQFISEENVEFLKTETFDNCLKELYKMDNFKFYNGLSLYYILETRIGKKKFIRLSGNEDFVAEFKSCLDLEDFKSYKSEWYESLELAQKKREILVNEEEKLNAVFEKILPDLIIQKIAYYSVFDSLTLTSIYDDSLLPPGGIRTFFE